ncbi:hypothetical protein BO71DRAFT_433989 [Aspergillus ellipticus CBS 707.79]|uniref:Heterokaryon incompatibility domain-containing protein n=1 Tax=Aspergillus ellipticus CBS 707.79 TaxID=1448320 RepID=A0A319CZA3_9EURO|nr:hypothetical protein BO71DRAFT_433989 [Aspergillus ellipticus CBS 707.79]
MLPLVIAGDSKQTSSPLMKIWPFTNLKSTGNLIPLTIQEAIILARRLRIRFICIIQNNAEDWNREAMKMGACYQNALLVIAATRSAGANNGMFGPRFPIRRANGEHNPKTFETGEFDFSPFRIRKAFDYHRFDQWPILPDPNVNPLTSRGWGSQERLLATCTVHIAAQELVWECKEAAWCECDLEWLSHYSQRLFTFNQDKLVVFEGVARRFQNLSSGRYLFGIWEKFLVTHLLWSTHVWANPPLGPNENNNKIIGPSWSWISTKHEVIFRYSDYHLESQVEIRGLPSIPQGFNHRDAVVYPPLSIAQWSLSLEAKVFNMRAVLKSTIRLYRNDESIDNLGLDDHDPNNQTEYKQRTYRQVYDLISLDHQQIPPSFFKPDFPNKSTSSKDQSMTKWKRVNDGDIVACILLGQSTGIFQKSIMLVAKPSSDYPNVYIRVGIAENTHPLGTQNLVIPNIITLI